MAPIQEEKEGVSSDISFQDNAKNTLSQAVI